MTTMKNKLTKSLLGVAVLSMIFTSCSESFLEKEPTSFLTPEQLADIAKLNPNALKSSISGLYALTLRLVPVVLKIMMILVKNRMILPWI